MNFNNAEFYTSYGTRSQIPSSEKVEIVFSGRSNVGKSSLINKILNRKAIARVSSMPGKTITINFFSLEDIFLVDLPGYGFAKVSKGEKRRWSDLIESYLGDENRMIGLIIQLVDMRHSPTADDMHMISFLIENEFPFIIALTKADKLSKKQQDERLQGLLSEIPYADQIKMVPFSSINGQGVDEIRNIIEDVAVSAKFEETQELEEDMLVDIE